MTTPRNDAPWAADPPEGRSLQEEMAIQIERGHPDGAAFLDGLSDEDLAEFALALQVQAELEAQDAPAAAPAEHDDEAGFEPEAASDAENEAASEPGVIPLRRPERRPRRLEPRWVAIAAVLAGVMLLPFAWRAMQGGPVREPSQAVAMLENPAAGLPAGSDDHPWSRTRGGAGDPLGEEARSVRFGAYMVDLELAVRARDAGRTQSLVGKLNVLAQDVQAGGLLTNGLGPVAQQAGGEPSALLAQVEEVNETAADLLDADWFALGAWVEAARLAAARRDAEFFRSARTRRTLDRAEEVVGDDQGARDALAAVRAAAGTEPADWTALKGAVDTLLHAIA